VSEITLVYVPFARRLRMPNVLDDNEGATMTGCADSLNSIISMYSLLLTMGVVILPAAGFIFGFVFSEKRRKP
jgi:hypothetical protein